MTAESITVELTGLSPATSVFTVDELRNALDAATEIAYEQTPDGSLQKRVIEQVRTLYRRDSLNGLLPLGQLESMALPGESYKLAFTPGLLDVYQSKASRAELTGLLTGPEGGYRDLEHDGRLWIPSGRLFYSPTEPTDPANVELAYARNHFFTPRRFVDPFGNAGHAEYDADDLLVVSTRDALGNTTRVDYDYRVLQPYRVTDINGNRREVRFDTLGLVVGTAVMGKAAGPAEGDNFDDFTAELTAQEVTDFFDAANPRALAVQHLGSASTRVIYDLDRVPVCAAAIQRETHVSDLAPGTDSKVHLSFVYSDGFGRVAQTKAQAEPGPLDPSDSAAPVQDPRWAGTGTKVYDNKGAAVREYEPFFSATPHFGINSTASAAPCCATHWAA